MSDLTYISRPFLISQYADLTTRNGLKKIHRDFDAIYRRLDRLYEKNSSNEKIVGAVVGIYAKMCADSILRDKLFKAGKCVCYDILILRSCRDVQVSWQGCCLY